jgi:hypothetical protein
MDRHPLGTPIGIPSGSLLRIENGAGVLVYVWEGELWITEDGSPKDHVLQAGQSYQVSGSGATLAQAFKRSLVSLAAPVSERAARRITLIPEVRPSTQGFPQMADELVMAV